MNLDKGQKVEVKNNEILTIMGIPVATGTVFALRPDNSGFSLKCDQTNAIETVDFGDGELTKL